MKIFESIKISQIILPIIYIIVGFLIFEIIKKIINKMIKVTNKTLKTSHNQKLNTIRILILNIIKYLIIIFVIIAILANFGINVKSILAGLGIGTAIVGLAFQDLAKDIIAGIFIIGEGQYEVGDTIEIDGFMGEVIFVGLKTTRIKNYKGAVKIISNRNMDKIINYSLNNSLAIVDVAISYDNSPEEIEKVFSDLFKKINGKIEHATGELQLLGITDLGNSAVVYRVALEVESMQQFAVERYLKKIIKETLDKENIKIPYNQIEVHNAK